MVWYQYRVNYYECLIVIKSKCMKQRLKMIWQILRDKQAVVITENHGKLCYSWDTRKVGDVFQMCSKATNEIYLKSINE